MTNTIVVNNNSDFSKVIIPSLGKWNPLMNWWWQALPDRRLFINHNTKISPRKSLGIEYIIMRECVGLPYHSAANNASGNLIDNAKLPNTDTKQSFGFAACT
jgi:hypothetical protein